MSGKCVIYRKEKLREGEMGTMRAIGLRDKNPARWEQLKQETAAINQSNPVVPSATQSSTSSGKQVTISGTTVFSGTAQVEYAIQFISCLFLEIL